MQIALLAVFMLGIPVHLVIQSGTFFAALLIVFVFGVLYRHFEIAFTKENPDYTHERHFSGPDEGRSI